MDTTRDQRDLGRWIREDIRKKVTADLVKYKIGARRGRGKNAKAKSTGTLAGSIQEGDELAGNLLRKITLEYEYYGIFVHRGSGRSAKNSTRQRRPWLSRGLVWANKRIPELLRTHYGYTLDEVVRRLPQTIHAKL